jgi:hypothetical protein
MKALLLIPLLLASAPAPATAAVYLNDASMIDSGTFGSCLTLTQSPNGYVLVEVNRLTPTTDFEFIYRGIAAYYALFSLSSGEELTYLNAGLKPMLGGFGAGNTLSLSPGQDAYIGYWSQRGGKPASPTPEPDDIFGWARVTNTAGTFVITSSASADTGIITGTTQAIPEPGSALLASAASFALLRRRRIRHLPNPGS